MTSEKSMSERFKVSLPSGKEVRVQSDQDLRKSLLKHHKDEIYSGVMSKIHCRGFGTCGTCAMKVEGEVSPMTSIEKWRLNFPPHKDSASKGVRLLCQCRPLSDLKLKKLEGLWGQG